MLNEYRHLFNNNNNKSGLEKKKKKQNTTWHASLKYTTFQAITRLLELSTPGKISKP